jgi:hypothetical protein
MVGSSRNIRAHVSLNDTTCQELARAHHDKKEIDGCSVVVVLQTLTMYTPSSDGGSSAFRLMLGLHPRFYSGETQR